MTTRLHKKIDHHIQRHIIGRLARVDMARFRDLRPPQTDSNLYAYHLKSLVRDGYVEQDEAGYRLTPFGLSYVDTMSLESLTPRIQPKIITMMVIQDGYGQVLLQKRDKQPFINSWTLIYGKTHMNDKSVLHAAYRETKEKTGLDGLSLSHSGDAYLHVTQHGQPVSTTLAHIFYAETDEVVESDDLMWCDPAKLGRLDLAPCVEAIVARTFFRDPFFFEEFHENWRG